MAGVHKNAARSLTPDALVNRDDGATEEQVAEIKRLLEKGGAAFTDAIRDLTKQRAERLILNLRRANAEYS